MFRGITSKLFKSHKVKFSKNRTPPQNSSTLNTTLSEGLIMPCANCTMMGSTTNSILTPSCSATCGIWMNLSFLDPINNPQFCHLFYNLILTSWRPCFRVPLFQPQGPLGESTYLGQCTHLPKVAWGNPLPNVCCCHNWNIWPWIGPASPS